MQNLLKRRLPKQLRKALADYIDFAGQPPPADAKGFAAHQAACKAALAHLDAGLKLLAWAGDRSGGGAAPEDDLARLIEAAEAAVARAGDDGVDAGDDLSPTSS